jgi:hypothetical protein
MRALAFALAAAGILVPALSAGDAIDFEDCYDGEFITSKYAGPPWYTTFALEDISGRGRIDPQVAEVATERTAFAGPHRTEVACDPGYFGPNDMPEEDQGVGCFFLTDDGAWDEWFYPIVITYGHPDPICHVGGDVIDLDRREDNTSWESLRFTAYNTAGEELATFDLDSPPYPQGEGKALPWQIDTDEGIHSVRIEFTGFRPVPGMAFDNFWYDPVCASPVEEGTWGTIKVLYR